ncbi:cytochrome c oxidase assembly protein cox16 homolog, mitochondrial [Plakobranchus ocellatus]|uniref:Cytochrome c oxidase assembly protein COX16 homolog, mitochondrial n=1 Tax=Plakobranchus ocellatus TaxID=259542 RepID=A0AAV3ZTQ5_9GAST|nr:cytochrome c oxidase assembly protein cox16 homolog, mitochondrial [Plakobranchus ocellatus]
MNKNNSSRLHRFLRSRFARTGVPFVIFIVGGSFFLKQFASVRYEFRKGKRLSKDEAESLGLKTADVQTVTQDLLKDIQKGDLDNWQNIRGPRPWEDSKTYQTEERAKIAQSQSQPQS